MAERAEGEQEVEGYVVVSHAYDCAEMRVDSFSGFGGDIYATYAEAEEIRGLTSATMAIHKPEMRYQVAELRLIAMCCPLQNQNRSRPMSESRSESEIRVAETLDGLAEIAASFHTGEGANPDCAGCQAKELINDLDGLFRALTTRSSGSLPNPDSDSEVAVSQETR